MIKISYPVDVISLCEADGQIRPLRIRFQDEEQLFTCLNIEQVLQRDKIHFVGAEAEIFLCKATIKDQTQLIRLKYSYRNCSWCIMTA